MKPVIYKYPLSLGITIVGMPEGAQILTAQMQNGFLQLWAMVQPDKPLEQRRFEVFGTGEPIELPAESPYVATVQDGPLVWHVFESF